MINIIDKTTRQTTNAFAGLTFIDDSDTPNIIINRVKSALKDSKLLKSHLCGIMIRMMKKKMYCHKITEIAQSEDIKWVMVMIDGDNIKVLKEKNESLAQESILQLENKIITICKIDNINNKKKLGYHYGNDNAFTLLIYNYIINK